MSSSLLCGYYIIVSCSSIIIPLCCLKADEIYVINWSRAACLCQCVFFFYRSVSSLPIGFFFAITSFGRPMSSHGKRNLKVQIKRRPSSSPPQKSLNLTHNDLDRNMLIIFPAEIAKWNTKFCVWRVCAVWWGGSALCAKYMWKLSVPGLLSYLHNN